LLRQRLPQLDGELAEEFRREKGPRPRTTASTTTPSAPVASVEVAASSVSVAALKKALEQQPLLSPAHQQELNRGPLSQATEVRTLARELVQRGWLTAYQVNQLLQGRGRELVLGPYIILERLGEGGAGQVFKARHQKMGRLVALKLIRKEL